MQVLTCCVSVIGRPPKTKITSCGDELVLADTKLIETVADPVPEVGCGQPIHGGGSGNSPSGYSTPSNAHWQELDDVNTVKVMGVCEPAGGSVMDEGLNPVTQPAWASAGSLARQMIPSARIEVIAKPAGRMLSASQHIPT